MKLENYDISYRDNLNRILSDDTLAKEKNQALFVLFSVIVEDITDEHRIHFTTLFSRLSFLTSFYDVNKYHNFFLHRYRYVNEKGYDTQYENDVLELGEALVLSLVKIEKGRNTFQYQSDSPLFQSNKKKNIGFKPMVKTLVKSIDEEEKVLLAVDEENAHEDIKIRYDESDKNEIFTPDILKAIEIYGFPILINLVDVSIDEDGYYSPMAFVIDPHFLVDVTRIAETFVDRNIESKLTLIRRFMTTDPSKKPLLLGNIANMLFDEILHNPEVEFKDLTSKIYAMNPLALALYNDSEIMELVNDARKHFHNLQKVVNEQLKKVNISREHVYLEPSFYASDYGLQGRLDLLHDDKTYDIIELKSGKPYKANRYGLSDTHYVQTLLYDLMVFAAFGDEKVRRNYILYSREEESLRYAPAIKAKQYEALHSRNTLVIIDKYMSLGARESFSMLRSIRNDAYPRIKGFVKRDIQKIEHTINALEPHEQIYIGEFTAFTAREQRLAKVGEHGLYKDNGLAALWLEVDTEKEARFSLLKQMELVDMNDNYIRLKKSGNTARLANFREGDIAVFYPHVDHLSAVLKNQIFKCSIVEVDDEVVIKLRNTQYNNKIFEEFQYWNIEADILDSSFNASYRSLLTFAQLSKNRRKLLLGQQKSRSSHKDYTHDYSLSPEQNTLVQEIINADDYYLLWGPPGTGKTSVMIKKLAHLMYEGTEPFLLLAYTNKAVDEICDAIADLPFIRIGSEHSCSPEHRHRLLNNLTGKFRTRKEIIDLLGSHRIYVGTVSSMLGKSELFKLMNFETVIIDEASQILEPMMLGILSQVRRFILVGDHKQLPAVVKQKDEQAIIDHSLLLEMGISNMKMSFFERLVGQCQKKGWESVGILSHQGRMHQSLMKFPNEHFYDGALSFFKSSARLSAPSFFDPNFAFAKRQIYIPTPPDNTINWKTNEYEAVKTAEVIKLLVTQYEQEGKILNGNSIGVIAPYRAHIALIDKHLKAQCPEIYNLITIDTVERYQGGARDIIILSLCTNSERQFESLVSLSTEGIDRKLNVALTRAKEQIIILGNEKILNTNRIYAQLISEYEKFG